MWPVKLGIFARCFLPPKMQMFKFPFSKIFEISKKGIHHESCHFLIQSYKEGQHSIAGAVEIPNMESSNETTLAQDSVSTSQESVRTGISGWILAMVLQYSLGCAWDTEVLREKFCHSNFAKFARSSSSTSSQVALRGALFPKRWWSSDWYDKSMSWINLSFWKEVGNVIILARQSIRCCFFGGKGGWIHIHNAIHILPASVFAEAGSYFFCVTKSARLFKRTSMDIRLAFVDRVFCSKSNGKETYRILEICTWSSVKIDDPVWEFPIYP